MEESPLDKPGSTRPLLVRLSFRLLPHLALLSIFFIYLIIGAVIFMELEGEHGDVTTIKKDMDKMKKMITESHNCSQPAPPSCNSDSKNPPIGEPGIARNHMGNRDHPSQQNCTSTDDIYDHWFKSYEGKKEWKIGRMQNIQANRSWEFYSAMLFCATTITTVGYGELVPVTPAGQITCIVYALIGIPLTLLVLADIGGSLGKIILLICKLIRPSMVITRIRQDSPCICCIPSRGRPNQDESALQTLSGTLPPSKHTDETGFNGGSSQQQPASDPPTYTQSISEQKHNIRENIYSHTNTADPTLLQDGYIQQYPDTSLSTHHSSLKDIINMPCEQVVEEVPLTIVILIFCAYTAIGAYAISHVEDWKYHQAVYFTVITLTTIGFGDFIPSKHYENGEFISCLLFTLFGMAVTSMCISLAQSKVIRFCKKMSMKFGF